MILCPSCGAENADGMRFCVKCGGTIADSSPTPGSWQQPSGNLYDTPAGGADATGTGGGTSYPGSYAPPPASYGYGVGGAPMVATSIGGYPIAQWGDRVLAALIDGALVVVLIFILYFIFGAIGAGLAAVGGEDSVLAGLGGGICCIGMILIPISMFIIGIYNKVILITKRGSSIGQGIMKLKVLDANGQLLQTGPAVIRLLVQMGLSVVPFVGVFLILLDLLWPLWDPQRQTLHDKAVGSFVVKTEG